VERNRLKRRVREAWRALQPRLGAIDCVVVARPPAASWPFPQIAQTLERCLTRLGVLDGPTPTTGR
jgi:ribonuclease P protein component